MTMREEIHEQPSVLRRLLREGRDAAEYAASMLRRGDVQWIYIAARGSSDHAAIYAKYVLGVRNRIPVALAAPSIFSLYGAAPDLRHALVLAISQSGASPDILGVVSAATAQHRPTIAVTNTQSSPLAGQVDEVFNLLAGEERSVAATKTYSAELMAVAMLSAALSGEGPAWDNLRAIPDWMDAVLASESQAEHAAQVFAPMDRCMVLARGFNLATAHEWALKMKEVAGVFAEPYSTADFLHGPMVAAGPETSVLGIASAGAALQDVMRVLRQLGGAHRSRLLVLSNCQEALLLTPTPLPFPESTAEWLSPMVAVVAAQLFSYWLAVYKGCDPERPAGLSKVTLTT